MEAGSLVDLRLKNLEENQKELVDWRRRVDVGAVEQREQQRSMRDDMSEVLDRVKVVEAGQRALMRVIIGGAISVAGSALIALLTVLTATGKI